MKPREAQLDADPNVVTVLIRLTPNETARSATLAAATSETSDGSASRRMKPREAQRCAVSLALPAVTRLTPNETARSATRAVDGQHRESATASRRMKPREAQLKYFAEIANGRYPPHAE